MVIPFWRPCIDDYMKDAVLKVMDSGNYILGKECRKFEEEFAEFIGVKHAILTSSGTSAIFLTLKALGIGNGDGVLVPSMTAFPTVEPIFHVGARPIFIDIDDMFTMSIPCLKEVLENRSSVKIKVILPVHLYGHPADMDSIMELANEHGITVVEDCCQAHGALYKRKKVGSIGVAGCFSFYPTKNLTVFGDGGMIVTSDDRIAKICRMLRDHGRQEKYNHELVGYNMRSNEIQAAIGRHQLKRLDSFNESRRRIAKWYDRGLTGLPLQIPIWKESVEHVYHLYVIRVQQNRSGLMNFLERNGIQVGIHYPIPCHKQLATIDMLGPQPKLSFTEDVATRIVSLPMYPGLEENEIDSICRKIREFYAKG